MIGIRQIQNVRSFASVIAAFFGLAASGAAFADPVTYADADGTCDGLAPCYTTINEAVLNAEDLDGANTGTAAQVFVFPGAYSESVNLNDLSGGAGVGDVHLVTVDDAGVPAPGTVTVSSPAGTAIARTGILNGDVLIDGFVVAAPAGNGVFIDSFDSIEIRNVVANGSGGIGVFADNFLGTITVANCTANGNSGTGIQVNAGFGSAHLTNLQANANGARGIGASASDGGVMVTTVTASGNVTDGLWSSALTNVSISGATADGNGSAGIRVAADTASVQSSHANENDFGVWMSLAGIESANVRDTIADENAILGIRVSNTGGSAIVERCSASNGVAGIGLRLNVFGPVLVRDVIADGNGSAGMEIEYGEVGATLENCSADENVAGHGIRVDGFLGLVHISDTTADGNGTFGIEVPPFLEAPAVIERTSASGNVSGFGISLTVVGDVLITDTVTDGNGSFGIFALSAENNVTIERCSANGNLTAFGISTDSLLNTSITDTSANQNGTFGMRLDLESGDATVRRCSANANLTAHGIDLFVPLGGVGALLVADTVADGNASFGIRMEAESGGPASVQRCQTNDNLKSHGLSALVGLALTVRDCLAHGNDDVGMFLGSYSELTAQRCSANNNGTYGFSTFCEFNLILSQLTAIDNTTGLRIINFQEATIEDSRFERNDNGVTADMVVGRLVGSIICGNEFSGVNVIAGTTLLAGGNWWGAASGPTHPNNPGGAGDTVIDAANGGAGVVQFDPWIETVTASVNPPVSNIGDMVDVTFQFADAAKTVFLGAGPGDPNGDPPFEITTDNGDLTASTGKAPTVKEFVNEPNGKLGVIAEPTAGGPVNVMLTGPCGLGGMVALQAVAADLSIDKSDDADPVIAGDNIVYKLVVTNHGPSGATGVTVADVLPAAVDFVSAVATQGTCGEASGTVTCDLGTLANGATVEVTIAVKSTSAGSMSNTATVSANEVDPTTANNASTETTTVNAPAVQPGPQPMPMPEPMQPGEQMPPSSQPVSEGMGSMFGFCGFGTAGMLPWMFIGTAYLKRRAITTHVE